MPVMGDPWAFSCSLNLASCRQRAECLARQLHANLWSPRSSFSSDGGSRSVSPSLGFFSPAALPLVIVDRAPKLEDARLMSSLDDDDISVDIVVSTPTQMTPPQSPVETQIQAATEVFYAEDPNSWMPESPSESFGSGSLQSDSPALTIELEEHSTSSSADTVSSPTNDLRLEKNHALADELCSRLRQFESLQINGRSVFSPQAELPSSDSEEHNCTTPVSYDSSKQDTADLLTPDSDGPCLIRSTSLRTGKTPPDTPNRKKIVRFADAMGLDLEAVRHFVKDDDIPLLPSSNFSTKLHHSVSLPWAALPGQSSNCHFVPQFVQPAANPHFLDRVRQEKVALENLMVNELRATGVVRVLNLGYEKQLFVRYTTSEWAAHSDLTADYVPQSCDGFSDKFTFTINMPHLGCGQRMAFALQYIANGQEFWDNNKGINYILKVQTKPNDPLAASNNPKWMHLFM